MAIAVTYAVGALTPGTIPLSSVTVLRENDGFHAIYLFSYVPRAEDAYSSLSWDVGDGIPKEGRTLVWVFPDDGAHEVRLNAVGAGRRPFTSPPIRVRSPASFDFKTAGITYLVVNKTGGFFALPGRIEKVTGEPGEASVFPLAGECGGLAVYRTIAPGFFEIEASSGARRFNVNLFVSPIESVHVDRSDLDWYRTQFATDSTSNCGPTVVSMGIAWAKAIDVPVAEIRRIVGWQGSGAVDFTQMKAVLARYGIQSTIVDMASARTIFQMIDRGHIVGLLYSMEGLSRQESPHKNLFGQYYSDHGGHYLAIKGYSADRRYFIVYDPIPSDWAANAKRYADGISMYGRNRYYPVEELTAAMRTTSVLEIAR